MLGIFVVGFSRLLSFTQKLTTSRQSTKQHSNLSHLGLEWERFWFSVLGKLFTQLSSLLSSFVFPLRDDAKMFPFSYCVACFDVKSPFSSVCHTQNNLSSASWFSNCLSLSWAIKTFQYQFVSPPFLIWFITMCGSPHKTCEMCESTTQYRLTEALNDGRKHERRIKIEV